MTVNRKRRVGCFGIYSRELEGELAQHTYFRGSTPCSTGGQESAGIAISDGERTTAMRGTWGSSRRSSTGGGWLRWSPGISRSGTSGTRLPASASWEKRAAGVSGTGRRKTWAVAPQTANLVKRRNAPGGACRRRFLVQTPLRTRLSSRPRWSGNWSTGVPSARRRRRRCGTWRGLTRWPMICRDALVAFRDPHGFRPLCIGEVAGGYVVSSETCGLDIIGAKFVRTVKPGEVVVIDDEGLHSYGGESPRHALCVFEYVYFARPRLPASTGREVRRLPGTGWASCSPKSPRQKPTWSSRSRDSGIMGGPSGTRRRVASRMRRVL